MAEIGLGETSDRKEKAKGFFGKVLAESAPRVVAIGVGTASGRAQLAGDQKRATTIRRGSAVLGFFSNLMLKAGTAKSVAGAVEMAGLVLVGEHEVAPLTELVAPVTRPMTDEEKSRAASAADAQSTAETETQAEAAEVQVASAKAQGEM